MYYLLKIVGETKNIPNSIITMRKGKITTFENLYDDCTKLQYDLSYKGVKYIITCFEITVYSDNDEMLGVTSLNAFNKYIIAENKYPEDIKEILKYN